MSACFCTGECRRTGRCPNAPRGGFFDLPNPDRCDDPDHKFPTHLHIPAGKGYTHICPACGKEQTVIAPRIS